MPMPFDPVSMQHWLQQTQNGGFPMLQQMLPWITQPGYFNTAGFLPTRFLEQPINYSGVANPYAVMFSPYLPTRPAFSLAPYMPFGIGGSPMGQVAGTIGGMAVQGMASGMGYSYFGNQNPYVAMDNSRVNGELRQYMDSAFNYDIARFHNYSTRLGLMSPQVAKELLFSGPGQLFSKSPLMDAILPGGSAAEFARHMFVANRVNLGKGGMLGGLSTPDLQQMTTSALEHFMPGGIVDYSKTRGFTAGQIGEIATRSVEYGAISLGGNALQMGAGGNLTTKMNDFKAQLDKMVELTKIMADMSAPGAPIGELIENLQRISGGALGRLPKEQIGALARDMQMTSHGLGIPAGALSEAMGAGASASRLVGNSSPYGAHVGLSALRRSRLMQAAGVSIGPTGTTQVEAYEYEMAAGQAFGVSGVANFGANLYETLTQLGGSSLTGTLGQVYNDLRAGDGKALYKHYMNRSQIIGALQSTYVGLGMNEFAGDRGAGRIGIYLNDVVAGRTNKAKYADVVSQWGSEAHMAEKMQVARNMFSAYNQREIAGATFGRALGLSDADMGSGVVSDILGASLEDTIRNTQGDPGSFATNFMDTASKVAAYANRIDDSKLSASDRRVLAKLRNANPADIAKFLSDPRNKQRATLLFNELGADMNRIRVGPQGAERGLLEIGSANAAVQAAENAQRVRGQIGTMMSEALEAAGAGNAATSFSDAVKRVVNTLADNVGTPITDAILESTGFNKAGGVDGQLAKNLNAASSELYEAEIAASNGDAAAAKKLPGLRRRVKDASTALGQAISGDKEFQFGAAKSTVEGLSKGLKSITDLGRGASAKDYIDKIDAELGRTADRDKFINEMVSTRGVSRETAQRLYVDHRKALRAAKARAEKGAGYSTDIANILGEPSKTYDDMLKGLTEEYNTDPKALKDKKDEATKANTAFSKAIVDKYSKAGAELSEMLSYGHVSTMSNPFAVVKDVFGEVDAIHATPGLSNAKEAIRNVYVQGLKVIDDDVEMDQLAEKLAENDAYEWIKGRSFKNSTELTEAKDKFASKRRGQYTYINRLNRDLRKKALDKELTPEDEKVYQHLIKTATASLADPSGEADFFYDTEGLRKFTEGSAESRAVGMSLMAANVATGKKVGMNLYRDWKKSKSDKSFTDWVEDQSGLAKASDDEINSNRAFIKQMAGAEYNDSSGWLFSGKNNTGLNPEALKQSLDKGSYDVKGVAANGKVQIEGQLALNLGETSFGFGGFKNTYLTGMG